MANSKKVKECKWKAIFRLKPEKISIERVKDLPHVKLITKDEGDSKYITAIEVTTPSLSFVDAINYSKHLANRCADIVSYIQGYSVSCYLHQINEIGPPGTLKTGAAFVSLNAIISKKQTVDITKQPFSDVFQNRDIKLARQLSHYRRGLSTTDIIDGIQDFYQVLEDEYTENHPIMQKYKYVRHLVSHPELTKGRSPLEAIKIVGKTYLDPSAPKDLEALQKHLKEIKDLARVCIESKV